MWVRTERGAINLQFCRSIVVHPEHNEDTGVDVHTVCALMDDNAHYHIAVRSDYEQARSICASLVERLTGEKVSP